MEFIEEEIDIKYEYDTGDDLDLDHDLGSSSHSTDWKLNPTVESRVMLETMKSLDSDKEVQGNPDYKDESEMRTSSGHTGSVDVVDKSCGIYRKLKLLVDLLKNCEKSENCGLCVKYIRQLQDHLLLTHGNNQGEAEDMNSIETTVSASDPVPVSLDRNHVPSEKDNQNLNISHGVVDKNSGDELVPSLTIATENEGESIPRKTQPNIINRKSIPKGGKSKPYKCYKCQMTFLTLYELSHHKTIHTEEREVTESMEGNTVLTPTSTNQQRSSTAYLKHQFKCDVCPKGFHNSSNLTRHKRTHTGGKPHKCDVCGKCFVQNGTLTRHKLTHTGDEPHRCDLCGKGFTQNIGLVRHKLVHSGEKPHKCDVCGKCFGQKGNLTQHYLAHTGEKPHICGLCGKCFRVSSHLTTHKRTHTGEKPYKCDVCGKCFRQIGSLTVHKFIHTGEKPHKCERCGKCFTHSRNLTKHTNTHRR